MQYIDGRFVLSPSDVTRFNRCQWSWVRELDSLNGKCEQRPLNNDPLLAYGARVGNRHENFVLNSFQEQFGVEKVFKVSDVKIPKGSSPKQRLLFLQKKTKAALKIRTPVVYQATFFDGRNVGHADFLQYVEFNGSPGYMVIDTKLSLQGNLQLYSWQLQSYSEHLKRLKIPTHSIGRIIHGDLSSSDVSLATSSNKDLETARQNLRLIEQERSVDPNPVAWISDRFEVCGKCPACQEQIRAYPTDLLRVAGLGPSTRKELIAKRIHSLRDLAESRTDHIEKIPEITINSLQDQAARQWEVLQSGEYKVAISNSLVIDALPKPTSPDLYFDFETDPFFYDEGSQRVGIVYLFGIFTKDQLSISEFSNSVDRKFNYLWADNRVEEASNFVKFMSFLLKHLSDFPEAKVYHYSAFEITTLRQLSNIYGCFSEELEFLLNANKFFDLKKTVSRGIQHGLPGNSIKKIELFYLDTESRSGTSGGADSIVRYDEYQQAKFFPNAQQDESPQVIKEDILAYNRLDCYSMYKLQLWLIDLLNNHQNSEPGPFRLFD